MLESWCDGSERDRYIVHKVYHRCLPEKAKRCRLNSGLSMFNQHGPTRFPILTPHVQGLATSKILKEKGQLVSTPQGMAKMLVDHPLGNPQVLWAVASNHDSQKLASNPIHGFTMSKSLFAVALPSLPRNPPRLPENLESSNGFTSMWHVSCFCLFSL